MVQPEGSGASTRESPQQGRDPWLFSQRSLRIWPLGLGGGIRIGSLRMCFRGCGCSRAARDRSGGQGRLGRRCSVGQAADFENRQTEPRTNYVTAAFSSACSPDFSLQVN